MDLITIYILAIVFIATLVRSTFGFGESLIAIPLLIFFIPIETAVPLVFMVIFANGSQNILGQLYKHTFCRPALSECLAIGKKDFGVGKSLSIFLSHFQWLSQLFSSEDISTIN